MPLSKDDIEEMLTDIVKVLMIMEEMIWQMWKKHVEGRAMMSEVMEMCDYEGYVLRRLESVARKVGVRKTQVKAECAAEARGEDYAAKKKGKGRRSGKDDAEDIFPDILE